MLLSSTGLRDPWTATGVTRKEVTESSPDQGVISDDTHSTTTTFDGQLRYW